MQIIKNLLCKIGIHIYDKEEISTSFNGTVDYYCANCQKKIFTEHIEDNKISRDNYIKLCNF